MKKDILLDIDGVQRDIVTTCIQIYKEYYDPKDTTVHSDIQVFDLSVKMPLITDKYKFFTENAKYIFGEAKPYDGALDFVKELDAISNIHIVTNQIKGTEKYTIDWLEQYKIPYKSLHFTDYKHIVKGDILIDDYIDNLIGFTGTPICYSQCWNKGFDGIRMDSYEEIINYIRGRK